jgi:hypothetical protein
MAPLIREAITQNNVRVHTHHITYVNEEFKNRNLNKERQFPKYLLKSYIEGIKNHHHFTFLFLVYECLRAYMHA